MTHDPSRLTNHLRALAVDEAAVPVDLAARAVAAARAAGRAPPSFLDELVVMARRGVMLGAATASVLAVLALGASSSSASASSSSVASATSSSVSSAGAVAVADNPLVSWWDASMTSSSTTFSSSLVLQ